MTLTELVQRAEKILKIDLHYILKGGTFLTIGNAVTSLASLALAIAFANLLSPTAYGIYKYIIAVGAMISAFSLRGINNAITQSVAQGKEGLFAHGPSLSLRWNAFAVTIALMGSAYYYWQGDTSFAMGMFLVALLSPFVQSFNISLYYLVGKKEFKMHAIIASLNRLIYVGGIILALYFTDNAIALIAASLGLQAILAILIYLYTYSKYQPNHDYTKESYSYAKHMSVMGVFGAVAEQVDKIVVFQLLGPIQLAVYSFALLLPEQVKVLFKPIATMALPKFSTRNIADVKRTMLRKTILLGTAATAAVIGYLIIAPYVYQFFFPQYTDSIIYSQLFALSLISLINALPLSALQAVQATKELYIINTTSPIIRIILACVLTYFYGIVGAILAIMVTRFAIIAMAYTLFYKKANTMIASS